ncbi:uncharacterized protein LOC116207026 [Punica granatum]|uniref:PHD-type zinc finger plants domain-containing protein n=2 Tax=Punica granatum TaxID=22663 RepID=A0A218X5B9_PUNGR|nr:uncharacterized protein LOC116207026 [Punica granatum]OWM80157.1 hypothetical protein CDL15_Pgr019321 [Punica granatum]PKI42026.1 hypothetical protein CRG98_037588 [Punica granatum]
MVDFQVVCCMCGDVGFPDKLFRCIRCLNRFQHSYCSNYYTESSVPIELCDWCQSEQRSSTRHGGSSSSSSRKSMGGGHDSDRVKPHDNAVEKSGKNASTASGVPSPRTTTRRYKLLKDVMC